MAVDIIIRNEADAWNWLKRALNDDPFLDEPFNLKFDGWPTLDLRFTGQDFNCSVPTRIMPPLLEAQKEIYRLYTDLRYGVGSLRKLKFDDRSLLELNVKVNKGSSEYNTNLDKTLTEIFRAAISNMESKHILIAVLSAAVCWGSTVAWKDWLETQAKNKDLETRVQMSQLEKEKLEVISRAKTEVPYVKDISGGINEFRNNSLHKLKPSDSFTVPDSDVAIDGNYASEITHTPREQSTETRIDGEFIIQSVASGETSGFKIKVKRVLDSKIINVTIPDGALSPDVIGVLKNNEWAKKPVVMEINAKMLRGEYTTATLVSAKDIKKKE